MSIVVLIAAACVLLAIAIIDAKTRRIPDALVMALAAIGFASVWVWPEIGVASRALGAVLGGAPFLTVAAIVDGSFGGGDVKLMIAAGVLLGWVNTLAVVVIALIAGGVYGIVLLALRRRKSQEHFAMGPILAASISVTMLNL
ncbi:MAG: A24 family peptidase [Clostridiales Family XIII bacterium]|nr:A24 family peptidase [Clostridiales Family XIII bacterium]